MSHFYSILFAWFGMVAAGLFYVGAYLPISISVCILLCISLYMYSEYRRKRLGVLLMLYWLVYALPFIHIPPYLFFDFSTDPEKLWGLSVNPYMLDKQVIELTAMIGAVGGLGIAFGISLVSKPLQKSAILHSDGSQPLYHTMSTSIWIIWLAVGVVLTALSAPSQTIFTARYSQSLSSLDGSNFDSAWMMSYVCLTFAFCDALFERNYAIRRTKMFMMSIALFFVVVFYQFLRGDRDCVPWVFGLSLAYYNWAASVTQRQGFRISWSKVVGVAIVLVGVSQMIGEIRSALPSKATIADVVEVVGFLYESGIIGLGNALHGTWSAVLLTPLSVAGDEVYSLLDVKNGEDYLNLFLSIVPGFLADAIGYVRPIDSNSGPAWEMRYGLGGTHATVLPFRNFQMLGVFVIPAIWASILVMYERFALEKISVNRVSLLITLAMVSPHWLWYGEKNGFNGVVICLGLMVLYRISIGVSASSFERRRIT